MGTLKINRITGRSGSVNNSPITLDGDTATLGSGADIKGAINASGTAPIYACRAFANFDAIDTSSANPLSFSNTDAINHGASNSAGETLCAIRSSGNISKVERVASGKYKVVFTTALPNANYAVVGNHAEDGEDYGNYGAGSRISVHNRPARTTSQFYVSTYVDSTGFNNMRQLDIIVFG
tara:strand:- start:49 stop:588 length:540 start_codon:yes stop_codon:yes gene_type:complete